MPRRSSSICPKSRACETLTLLDKESGSHVRRFFGTRTTLSDQPFSCYALSEPVRFRRSRIRQSAVISPALTAPFWRMRLRQAQIARKRKREDEQTSPSHGAPPLVVMTLG